jgi:1-deoxy-D-xylulose 5-phosphate reductoisomerase
MQAGGAASAVLNIVNELAVSAFMAGAITFDKIVLTVSEGIARYGNMGYSSLDDLLGIEERIRRELCFK